MNTFFFPRTWAALFLAGVMLIFAAEVRAAENEVVVISPHWDGIKEETARAFDAWHRGKYGEPAIIRWRDPSGGGSQITRFLKSEYQAGSNVGIDVLYGGGVDPFRDLEKDGLLTRYDPPAQTLAEIPAQLNGIPIIDPNHEWFGAALSGFGIITNQRVRAAVGLPEVHTWSDLADPRLSGWITATDPRASGSALAIYEIILQAYGWEKGWAVLTKISGNTRHFLASSASSAVEVGVGDAAYGVAIDVYGNAQAGYYGPTNVTFVLPEGQTVITPDCIAILKNPPHPEMARHFVEFVLSREGQLLWMLPKGAPGGATRYIINRSCVRPSLYTELAGETPITTNPFMAHSDFVYDDGLAAKRRAILSAIIAAWMIDTHDGLSDAWRALHSPATEKFSSDRQTALATELTAPPCTQTELLHLADADWKDPIKRTALVNRWQSEAMHRYKNLLAEMKSN